MPAVLRQWGREAVLAELHPDLPPEHGIGYVVNPTLTRSALHRCLVRHGISRLPASG